MRSRLSCLLDPRASDVSDRWRGWGIHILVALLEVQREGVREEGGEVTPESGSYNAPASFLPLYLLAGRLREQVALSHPFCYSVALCLWPYNNEAML